MDAQSIFCEVALAQLVPMLPMDIDLARVPDVFREDVNRLMVEQENEQ